LTETPPTDAHEAPAAPQAKRSRLRLAALIVGGVFAGLLALLIVGFVGGRTYLRSDPGREWVTRFVDGKKLSRYGRINIEGLRGDLFDDFTLGRVTVTDANGVWLEATDIRVDWSFGPLLLRRFHAQDISAGRIRLIRRPVLEPSTEPSKPMPLGVDIDRFSANIELEEGFSQEYGRWRLTGSAAVPRKGSKTAQVDAYSLTRRGDYLRGAATFGDAATDLRLNLRAHEAEGGPIAGALGYSPDQPFSAVAVLRRRGDAHLRLHRFQRLGAVGALGASHRADRPFRLGRDAGPQGRGSTGRGLATDRRKSEFERARRHPPQGP